MTPDQWIAHWSPVYPHHSDDLNAGLRRGPREAALSSRHLQVNTVGSKNMLTVDLDREDARFHVMCAVGNGDVPAPNWITVNPATGHAHVGWVLTSAVATSTKARNAPREFYNDVRRTLTVRLGGDAAYSGHATRNPVHGDAETYWGTAATYELNDMKATLGKLDKAPRRLKDMMKMENVDVESGRHQALFVEAATYSHAAWYRHYRDEDRKGWGRLTHEADVIAHSIEFNAVENSGDPLPLNEVESLAKSCAHWTWVRFNAEKFSEIQRARSSHQGAVIERQSRVQTLKDMAEGGQVLNAAQVMDVFSVSKMTAYSYLKDAGLAGGEVREIPDPATVAALKAQGKTQKAIADELGLSVRQVRHALSKA